MGCFEEAKSIGHIAYSSSQLSVRKLAYYLEDADITLRSDPSTFKEIFGQNTLNSKINNWAVEISLFRITFEYIKGIKNTLADTMSRLIEIDPSVEQIPEEDGHEYGYYAFDILPPMKTEKFEINEVNDDDKIDKELNEPKGNPNLPQIVSKLENLIQLQLEDPFCDNIIKQLNKGNLIERQPYFIEDYLLH